MVGCNSVKEVKLESQTVNGVKWIVNTFLDNFYENILNSTGVL